MRSSSLLIPVRIAKLPGFSFLLFLALAGTPLYSQSAPHPVRLSADELTSATLEEVGLHLPLDLTTVDQIQFQTSLSSHTQMVVNWDVVPGAPNLILARDRNRWTQPSTLTLVSTTPHTPGGLGDRILEMPNRIWAFGLTASNQVLSMTSIPDTRWDVPDDRDPESETMKTKVTLNFGVSNDRSLAKAALYEAVQHDNVWSLRLIGTLSIKKAE